MSPATRPRPAGRAASAGSPALVAVCEVEALERRYRLGSHDSHHPLNVAGCAIVRCAVVGQSSGWSSPACPSCPRAGSIVHATQVWSEPAGGGAVVARQIARLVGRCEFFTALGDDALGHEAAKQLSSSASTCTRCTPARRGAPGRTSTSDGERTITVLGDKLLPRGPLPLAGYDAVFFVSGDVEALRSARAARVLAATLRERPTLSEVGRPARPARRQPATTRASVRRIARRGKSSC